MILFFHGGVKLIFQIRCGPLFLCDPGSESCPPLWVCYLLSSVRVGTSQSGKNKHGGEQNDDGVNGETFQTDELNMSEDRSFRFTITRLWAYGSYQLNLHIHGSLGPQWCSHWSWILVSYKSVQISGLSKDSELSIMVCNVNAALVANMQSFWTLTVRR